MGSYKKGQTQSLGEKKEARLNRRKLLSILMIHKRRESNKHTGEYETTKNIVVRTQIILPLLSCVHKPNYQTPTPTGDKSCQREESFPADLRRGGSAAMGVYGVCCCCSVGVLRLSNRAVARSQM